MLPMSKKFVTICDVYRHESGRCQTLPFFLKFFPLVYFTFVISILSEMHDQIVSYVYVAAHCGERKELGFEGMVYEH